MALNVVHVVGARPNFMKAAPVMAALGRHGGVSQLLVHTGQHYDANMSEVFFDQLGLPHPDVNLKVGSASHAVQTAQIMIRLERIRIWERNKPDDDASNDLVAGADDKIFRVDRAELRECAELVTDRKELAALRRK